MKNLSLVIVLLLVVSQVLLCERIEQMGLTRNAAWLDWNRLSYMFIHANWIHLAINCYAFLSLVFISKARWIEFVVSFLVSMSVPQSILYDTPMVGISIYTYALSGMIIPRTNKYFVLAIINIMFIASGFLFPFIAAMAHLYGFVTALIISIFIHFLFDRRYE